MNMKKSKKKKDYYFESRVAEYNMQKRLFWKHIIITAMICFSLCFIAYKIDSLFSFMATIDAETDDNGNISIIDNLLGDING